MKALLKSPFNPPPDDIRIGNDEASDLEHAQRLLKTAGNTKEIGSSFYRTYYQFNIKFYNYNLKPLSYIKDVELKIVLNENYRGEDLFIKSLYTNILDEQFVFIIYFDNYDYCFLFGLFYINYKYFKNSNEPIYPDMTGYLENLKIDFDIENSPNDLIKIKDEQIVFMYVGKQYSDKLAIIIMDIFSFSPDIYTREFYINLVNFSPTQIKGLSYNEHLFFSASGNLGNNDYYYSRQDSANYLSIFMAFGYANGTDSTIDISKFIFKDNNEGDNNLFFLFNNLTIENNIFGYYPFGIIKLVHIPQEISIFQNYLDTEKEITPEEPFIGSDCLSDNTHYYQEGCIEYDCIIKQKEEMIKTSQYYYIDYQYILTDLGLINDESDSVYEGAGDEGPSEFKRILQGLNTNVNFGRFFPLYLGRINRLQFKLCHEYCETCYELDKSKDNHKCLSCLPQYQFDYLYFTNQKEKNPETCVPEGYYYDTYNNKLYECNTIEHKYYFNNTDNKTICFPDNDVYNCPSSYPIYNETKKECFYCDLERFKNGECTANNLTIESCTQCDYNCFMLGGCNFNDFNTSNNDFYQRIVDGGFLSNYNGEDGYLRMSNGNGYAFHLTTVNNELNSLKDNTPRNHSIIDLKDCADLLRSQNGLDSNEDLVILKYENENPSSNGIDKSIQYEVYLPNSNEKLDLSVCANTDITIYVPIELNEKTKKIYDSMREQGYNLFDRNDKFYWDICTPYKSIDGTDVILTDRINGIYEENKLTCQNDCEFSDYLPDFKYMKCECNVTNTKKIETKNPEKITMKSISKSFFNVLKYSNYKVLRCYNLVFRKVTIKDNVGSILSNIYFIGYLIAFFIFCYKKGEYLKIEIEKLLNNDNIEINKDNISIFKKNVIFNEDKLNNEINFEEKVNEGNKEIEVIKNKKLNINNNLLKSNKLKNKNIIKFKNNKIESNIMKNINSKKVKDIKSIKENFSENKILGSKDLSNELVILDKESKNGMSKISSDKENESQKSEKDKNKENEKEDLTDYELNDLEYNDALELDKRKFLNIYWYLLKREHIILFTFFNWNDYNFFSIKLSKLFLSICSDMAFNVFFFSDESMHNIYVNRGENYFIGQLAQMVYSTIISQILQTFINYLTMTDIHYYQLKELKKENIINKNKALAVIKCIKYKLIIFFSSTFILFLFFWYAISAFCAVYANTQGIFVADSYTSFLMGLLYPFGLYLAPTALRILSLKAKDKKNLKILYSLSNKIPFF